MCFTIVRIWEYILPQDGAKFDPMGLIVSHFCCILDIPALGIVVSEKIFFMFFFLIIADPKGMAGRIYKGNYYPLLYTKYKSPGLCDFREEDFYGFPIVSLWGLMTLGS